MNDRLQTILSTVLTIAAVAVGAVLVHREFFSTTPLGPQTGDSGPPTIAVNWAQAVDNGVVIGDSRAKVKVIVFSDLECPVCKAFESTLLTVRSQHPEIAIVFVHFPLPMHRFAQLAARASECANRVGRFGDFVHVAYGKQDSLGLKSWGSYASESGIPDTLTFIHCVKEPGTIARIDSGIAIGHRLGVHGTPTVLINQWRFATPPTAQDLARAISAVARGAPPS